MTARPPGGRTRAAGSRPATRLLAAAALVLLVAAAWAGGAAQPELAFSTYLGGSGPDGIRAVATDAQGNVYVAGGTNSRDFPTTPHALARSLTAPGWWSCLFSTCRLSHGSGGQADVVVAKFAPGGQLLWSTYLGGPNHDRAYAVAVDGTGHVYLAGRAGDQFPTTAGTVQPTFGDDTTHSPLYGKQDGFVAKLSPDGSRLVWSTFLGGADGSFIRDVDVDTAGNVYVVLSDVAQPSAHVTLGSFQPSHRGSHDCVVAKLRPDGGQVIWATYLGGSGDDGGGPSIRVHHSGRVYVVGNTTSPDFPTPGGFGKKLSGGVDVFLAVLDATGSRLEFATYLGGSSDEGAGTHNLAVDAQGHAYVGHWSKSRDIAIVQKGYQRTYGGGFTDGIVWKIAPTGELVANTYLGGSGGENIQGIDVDKFGRVYLSSANVSSPNFPVTADALQPRLGGEEDGAVTVLAGDLSRLVYSTYVGGRRKDSLRTLRLDPSGDVYAAGESASPDWPVRHPFQSASGGGVDGVLIRLTMPTGTPPR